MKPLYLETVVVQTIRTPSLYAAHVVKKRTVALLLMVYCYSLVKEMSQSEAE